MAESTRVVIADEIKLREILSERGLPAKIDAQLTSTERKIHDVLCAAYDFKTNRAAVEMPPHILRRCGPEFEKLWRVRQDGPGSNGKRAVSFSLTSPAIHMTLRTTLHKDKGILAAKINRVQLAPAWARFLRDPVKAAPKAVDWSKHEADARAYNAAVTEQILDGKTFNAQKDNPWARKHLKNRNG